MLKKFVDEDNLRKAVIKTGLVDATYLTVIYIVEFPSLYSVLYFNS